MTPGHAYTHSCISFELSLRKILCTKIFSAEKKIELDLIVNGIVNLQEEKNSNDYR